MANAAGWEHDLERDDVERYRDGTAWTDEVGPGEDAVGSDQPADHVPQLHRALSEAAADLEAVEDRLSTLFDRTDDPLPGRAQRTTWPVEPGGAATTAAAGPAVAGDEDDEVLDLFADGDAEDDDAVEEPDDGIGFVPPTVSDRMAIIGEYEDDIGGDFAELDAELAAEVPDEPGDGKRRMFRRRVKGTTAARH